MKDKTWRNFERKPRWCWLNFWGYWQEPNRHSGSRKNTTAVAKFILHVEKHFFFLTPVHAIAGKWHLPLSMYMQNLVSAKKGVQNRCTNCERRMKGNASNFITRQQMAALLCYKLGHVLYHLFFHLSWRHGDAILKSLQSVSCLTTSWEIIDV